MQYRLLHTLGLVDARECNKLGESLSIKVQDLAAGCVISLGDKGYAFLTETKGYKGLLEQVEKVRGVAKQPEVTGPAK